MIFNMNNKNLCYKKVEELINDSIINEMVFSINENRSLELLLTSNPLEREIKLYHGSSYQNKLNIIEPEAYNSGTRLSKPRVSSFWTDSFECAKLFGLFRLITKCLGYKECLFTGDHYHMFIRPSMFPLIEQDIKSKVIWIYEKTIDKDLIGAGHAGLYLDEFTIDFPVKPDNAILLKYNDFKDLFYDCMVLLPDDSDTTYKLAVKQEYENMLKFGKSNSNLIDKIIYRDYNGQRKIIKKYKKIAKESTEYLNESSDESKLISNFKKKNGKIFKYLDLSTASAISYLKNNDNKSDKDIKDITDKFNGFIVIDTDNDKYAGYVFITKKDNVISPLWVFEDYRGYGLGEELLNKSIQKYNADGLWVYTDNEIAIRLYKKYGFIETKHRKKRKDGELIFMDRPNNIRKESTEYLNESSKNTLSQLIIFNQKMNNMEYIVPNKGNIIYKIKADDFNKYYISLSPEEFVKYNGGVCWDYVIYESYYFKKYFPNIKFKTFFHFVDNKKDLPTHTFLIFNYNNKYYWFESSWKQMNGIYEFNSLDNALSYINNKLMEGFKQYKSYLTEFDASDNSMIGINCDEYMNIMVHKAINNNIKISNKNIQPNNIYNNKILSKSINESANNNNLFHLSQNNLDGKILQPRVPDNFLVKNNYEEGKTPRVCFATSIDYCLRAMSQNCTDMELYVHMPDGDYNTYKPSISEVPDCKVTGEIWIKKPVKLKCIGKIKVIKDKGEDGIPYKYGNNTAELYDWEWKWVDDFKNESYITENFDTDNYLDYAFKDGNLQYIDDFYNRSNKIFIVAKPLPSFINKNKLEDAIYEKEYKLYKDYWKKVSFTKGIYPCKVYEIYTGDDKELLNIINNENIPALSRIKTKFYHYNFSRGKLKCSALVLCDNKKVYAVYIISCDHKLIRINNFKNESSCMVCEETIPENDENCTTELYDTLEELFANTSYNNIWCTSDWHLFKNHYKKEKNYVNTADIIYFCKNNIKDNDIFIYLGDMSFRYANEVDNKKTQEIFKSLPGIKVLIIGNHDEMAGDDFYTNCGFDYIFQSFEYQNLIFTHRPINMDMYPDDYLNIHGHIHNLKIYNTCDGSKNINVYPYNYNNKPVKLSYLISHKDKLMKDNKWNPNDILGESAIDNDVDLRESKIIACNEGYDKLDAILNMVDINDITINDL